ncbi:hypothetical protein ACSBR2_033302 [Camellia fascicularis]
MKAASSFRYLWSLFNLILGFDCDFVWIVGKKNPDTDCLSVLDHARIAKEMKIDRLNDYGEEEDIWNGEGKMVVIANACKVPTTFVSELTESEDPDECVKHSDEDQELEQLISGEICLRKCFAETHTSDMERRIVLSGSFNPLHEGHLKLLEVATSRSSLSLSQQQQQQHQRGLVQEQLQLRHQFSLRHPFGRCGNLLWPGYNTDRPEYTGIPHVHYCSSSAVGSIGITIWRACYICVETAGN